ncbi:MAG: hypothetical protein H0T89_12265 [Deltaproteobacteria bacterium]|nr:hypothetical protein [Deltaproteobacteria bacterium]MDQ3300844.1 hypothetical protein [Myxococcota bacterium]
MSSIEALFGSRTAEILAAAVTPVLAAEVRARCERTGYTRYGLLDRGSYEVIADPDEPELLAALANLAGERIDRTLELTGARVLRLQPGDYLLAHHDQIHVDLPIEVVLDLSPAIVPGAEVHYRRRGQVFFRVPSTPCSLAIVERGPTVSCNHTYVSKLHAGASVVRLIALFRG